MRLWNGYGEMLIAVIAATALILAVKRKRLCFVLWIFTDCCWFVIDLIHGVPAQAALQAFYVIVNAWGFVAWRSQTRE